MPQTCSRCSRINPVDALYCYFDGSSLGGQGAKSAATGASQAFLSPFVFPTGQSCRTYDELARGCLHNWSAALGLLRQGHLEKFLGGLGRADLALAARAAANFPDPDRGLDQLLSRLPVQTVGPPKLKVEPAEVSLGTVKPGSHQGFELHLNNQGERLLYGSVVSDSKWLVLGEGLGSAQKLFQVRDEAAIPVQVRTEHLRASDKPVEGRLIIESSGGSASVVVRAQMTALPFTQGVLAGATSPRQLAEKAKAAPKEAAVLFQSGAVARWYQQNGWTYPVLAPAASGIAAVQQFFEALGLTKPPRVAIDESTLSLRAPAGNRLQSALHLRTPEKRPVFAHARSEQPWLTVGPVQMNGPAATIPLEVNAPPGAAGHTVEGRVIVTANGNQRFVVPVTLVVSPALPVAAVAVVPARSLPPAKTRPVARPQSEPEPAPARRRSHPEHLIPALLLLLLLFGLTLKDVFTDAPRQVKAVIGEDLAELKKDKEGLPPLNIEIKDEPEEPGEGPKILPVQHQVIDEPEVREPVVMPVKVEIKDEPQEGGGPAGPAAVVDDRPRIRFLYGGGGRFGVTVADTGKRLTYGVSGNTNTVVVKVDGQPQPLAGGFGFGPAAGGEQQVQLPANPLFRGQAGLKSTWTTGNVEFTQIFELVPSKQPVDVAGVQKRLVDTLLIRYLITNRDNRPHTVGIRNQVDTLIGSNDGVPFTVPGLPGLVNTFRDFRTPESVPDFIQALEVARLDNPGTVAHMTLKLGGKIEPPGRVSLTRWPGNNLAWDIPVMHMGSDSAVVLYWNDQQLAAGQTRECGFAYGLGSVSAGEATGRLGVTLGGSFEPGQLFTVTAYVTNPAPGQTLTLEMPKGLERVEGEQTQPVQGGATSVVTWKAKVLETGVFPLRVRSSTGISQTKTITIARPDGPTGGNFTLDLVGSFQPGQVFAVTANVKQPVPGQTLTLKLPAGLQRVDGLEVQPVPAQGAEAGAATVTWKVKVEDVGKHPVRVQSSTGVVQTKTIVIARADENAGKVVVSLNGDFAPGKSFAVLAHVTNPLRDQHLTLALGPGLKRVEGDEKQTVPPTAKDAIGTVTWKVAVGQPGKHALAVRSSTGVTIKKTLAIEQQSENAGKFTFEIVGRPAKMKDDFQVVALVTNPVYKQSLTLTLPPGLSLLEGDATQLVPRPAGANPSSTVTWRVRVEGIGRLPVRVQSTTGAARTKVLTLTGGGQAEIFR